MKTPTCHTDTKWLKFCVLIFRLNMLPHFFQIFATAGTCGPTGAGDSNFWTNSGSECTFCVHVLEAGSENVNSPNDVPCGVQCQLKGKSWKCGNLKLMCILLKLNSNYSNYFKHRPMLRRSILITEAVQNGWLIALIKKGAELLIEAIYALTFSSGIASA